MGERGDFVCINPDLSIVDAGGELVQLLGRVIGRYSCVVAVVPIVDAANKIVTDDYPVRQECTTVNASSEEHGVACSVGPTDHDQIHSLDKRIRQTAGVEIIEGGDYLLVHSVSGSR
jgi:hypothetical protein